MQLHEKYLHYVKYGLMDGSTDKLLDNPCKGPRRFIDYGFKGAKNEKVFIHFYNIGYNNAAETNQALIDRQAKQWLINNNHLTVKDI